jgi:hypothetical protein
VQGPGGQLEIVFNIRDNPGLTFGDTRSPSALLERKLH